MKNLSEVLADREQTALQILELLDHATDPWGIKVERVEVKDVRLPMQLQRAMAAEAEATREARAKVRIKSDKASSYKFYTSWINESSGFSTGLIVDEYTNTTLMPEMKEQNIAGFLCNYSLFHSSSPFPPRSSPPRASRRPRGP